uniref:Uncharacterized protein n=1 Tax=uncultured Thiotrichaceae bacterium TaxID=298394 RepID=A0A6S6SIU1_9GAMM|nr:MAG: Unknown protein [uncultured Thiotrichaceae bacterium]
MMKMFVRSLVLGASLLLAATAVSAGGIHYQVDTSTRFMADEAANLSGFRMTWTYEPEVSAVIIDGRNMDSGELRQLGEDIMEDLYGLGYYIQFTVNDRPVPFNKVTHFGIKLVENQRIQMEMQVDLKKAIPVAGTVLRLKLVDPDGSAVLVYSGAEKVVLANDLVSKCAGATLENQMMQLNGHDMDVQTASVVCQ